jgi:hypothetical protein
VTWHLLKISGSPHCPTSDTQVAVLNVSAKSPASNLS